MRLRGPSFAIPNGTALRRVLASGLAIVLLVLQLLVPQTGQAASGEWIEICGEFGATEIQVDSNGIPVKDIECPQCPTCALCALTGVVAMHSVTHSVQFAPMPRRYVPGVPSVSVRNPAQYWPDNRGPPIDKATIRQTGRAPLAPIHMKGEVPCS